MDLVAAVEADPYATPGTLPPETAGHRPVLLHPLIENLQPRPGQTVVDGTLGAGGVTAALLERVVPGGHVVAIDRDPAAVARARDRFAGAGHAVTVVHGDFVNLEAILGGLGIEAVDAVTLDLGISSLQLDDEDRGFAFRLDGPLDMRMDPSAGGRTAAGILNGAGPDELVELIRGYGEERFARSIVSGIVFHRREEPITTTTQLRQIVERAVPRRHWPKRIHPATRTFQALRIMVNDELGTLERGLQAAITVLRPGGRLGVISFHSLEDILVKNALHVSALSCVCPPRQPICTCAHRASLLLLSRKAIKPDALEQATNPRARSARLRVAEKL